MCLLSSMHISTKRFSPVHLLLAQVRTIHRRAIGGGQHCMAQRVGDPDRLFPEYARCRTAVSYGGSSLAAGHCPRRHHTLPGALREVLFPGWADKGSSTHHGHLSMWNPAGKRRYPGPAFVHVLPYVLRICKPGLRPADLAANSQLEAPLQILPLVSNAKNDYFSTEAVFFIKKLT